MPCTSGQSLILRLPPTIRQSQSRLTKRMNCKTIAQGGRKNKVIRRRQQNSRLMIFQRRSTRTSMFRIMLRSTLLSNRTIKIINTMTITRMPNIMRCRRHTLSHVRSMVSKISVIAQSASMMVTVRVAAVLR